MDKKKKEKNILATGAPSTSRLEPKGEYKLDNASSFYHELLSSELDNKDIKNLKNHISKGENFLRQTSRVEVKAFDSTFIDEMEEGLDAVQKILANPRTFIKEEAELVQAGLAKKISSLSVRHFASHSQFVRDIDEDGNVTPEKILTIHAETDTAIYENRFIMTLIKKCLTFIQTRYWFVVEHGETFDSDLLLLHNTTKIDGVKYEVDSRIKVSVPSQDNGQSQKNDDILKRLTVLRQRCSYFLRSPFMEAMKGAKDVASPIHMTNMLQKHPDYRRAYNLWIFLDKYEDLGLAFDVQEFEQEFTPEYKEELSTFVANSILTIHSNRVNAGAIAKANNRKYLPKVVFSLEDETYADARFLFDAFPEAKEKAPYPIAPLPEEVRLDNERFRQHLENERSAKTLLDEAILNDKDRIVHEEALKRIEKERALNAEREHYINYSVALEKENTKLSESLKKYENVSLKSKEEVKALESEVSKLRVDNEKMSKDLEAIKKDYSKVNSRYTDLKELTDAIGDLSNNDKNKIDSLNATIEELKKKLLELSTENGSLRAEIKELTKERLAHDVFEKEKESLSSTSQKAPGESSLTESKK